ncbi:MAG: hypothetical protein ABWY18_18040 [Tardiphaga sp.]|jgi:hypothetical protein
MASDDSKSTKAEREAASKALLDNMARLKAARLAREALVPASATPAKKKAAAKSGKRPSDKSGETSDKSQALKDWLASQQSGGRRI